MIYSILSISGEMLPGQPSHQGCLNPWILKYNGTMVSYLHITTHILLYTTNHLYTKYNAENDKGKNGIQTIIVLQSKGWLNSQRET